MRTRLVLSSVIACAMLTTAVYGQNNSEAKPAATATKGIKDAYAGKFLIGCAGDLGRGYSETELASIKANYDIVTPENCMKPQNTHPSEETYTFANADAMVKWCKDNNVKVWGHTLLWHAQTGRWMYAAAPGGEAATREASLARLRKHIETVAGRFKGQVVGWDVVNEAIADGGSGQTENLRRGTWYSAVGPDVLTMAFKYAHEVDPNAQLYYNDYNIEQGAVRGTGKHASSMLLLKRLIKEGAPINGVGIQGHWHLNTNLADVEKAITDYAELGLKVAITELDVTATGTNSGAFGGGQAGTVTPEGFQQQAQVYAKLFAIFNRHSDKISRVTFWGISDRRSWRSGQRPLLFDAQLKPKPAFQAVLDVAAGKMPTTQP